MMRILKTPKGDIPIRLPPPANFDSCFLFALHKSGSTLLYQMMSAALRIAGIPSIALPEIAFSVGLPDDGILNAQDFILDRGYCYLGFRSFPSYLRSFDLSQRKKILLIRDPRDMVVSLYFSEAYSHPLPPAGTERDAFAERRAEAQRIDINNYCIERIGDYLGEFEGYQSKLTSEVRIYRYEDVIFKKAAWLWDMVSYLGLTIDPSLIETTARQHNVLPETERPTHHIRQVTPGNFRKHLAPETISKLNVGFAEILKRYNYAI